MARRRHNNPWARLIDYDKAIAEDERQIASYTMLIEKGWFVDAELAAYGVRLADMAAEDATFAASCDLSAQDVADLHAYMHPAADWHHWHLTPQGKRGREISRRLHTLCPDLLMTEAATKKALKDVKRSLARHRRNKEKYGR